MEKVSADRVLERLVQDYRLVYFTRILSGLILDSSNKGTREWFGADVLLELLQEGFIEQAEERRKIYRDSRSETYVISKKGRDHITKKSSDAPR